MGPYSFASIGGLGVAGSNSPNNSTGALNWLTQPYQFNASGTLPGATNINIGNNMSINGSKGTIAIGPASQNGSTTENTIVLDGNSSYITIANPSTGVRQIIIGELPDGTYGMVVSKPGIDVLTLWS